MRLDRRGFLALGASVAACSALPGFAIAASANSDTRLLVVLLRGGMDGLHALPPVGDPAYAGLRGVFATGRGQREPHRLDSDFSLHGRLDFMSQLHARKQLLPVVAIAPPYRERSHFQAQDCVENGTAGTGTSTGWMNRCIGAVPGSRGIAIAAVMPLVMRGGADASSWSPPLKQDVDPILWQRLQLLYAADPVLAAKFRQLDGGEAIEGGSAGPGRTMRLQQSMEAAARFMSAAHGPRLGFVEDAGWDTHGNQIGILDRKFAELDASLKAFHDGARTIWGNTVVAIVTEFGRTAAINGTSGTDHGTGGVAFLAGGGVHGGRIAGDWPGIGKAQLNEGRDLRATTDMRSLFKGILRDHMGIEDAALARHVFPDSQAIAPMTGLLRRAAVA